ncbi:MAG: hypothetical protein Q9195_009185 [Heterodermia aff. obscurata]
MSRNPSLTPPQKSTWQENFIRNVLTIAIGFVPGVGPLLQIAFSVGWTLVTENDPKAAFDTLKSLCPGVELADNIVSDLTRGALEIRSYLPDGWQDLNLKVDAKPVDESAKLAPRPIEQMDAMVPMLLQKEVLDATGNSPDEEQKKSGDDVGDCSLVLENDELVVDLENAATDILDIGEDTLKSVADQIA